MRRGPKTNRKRTPFGIFCERQRAARSVTQTDQAAALEIRDDGFISSIEYGKKAPPDDYVERLIVWFQLPETQHDYFRALSYVNGRTREIRIAPADVDRSLIALKFARRLNQLSPEMLTELDKLLE